MLPLTHYEMLRLAPLIRDLVAFLSRVHRMAQGEEHLNYKEYGFHSIVDLHTFVREVSGFTTTPQSLLLDSCSVPLLLDSGGVISRQSP